MENSFIRLPWCYCIVLVHNHIDGVMMPSEADKMTTRALIEWGKLLNIAVLDHLIISEADYFSFQEHGLMEEGTIEA